MKAVWQTEEGDDPYGEKMAWLPLKFEWEGGEIGLVGGMKGVSFGACGWKVTLRPKEKSRRLV